MGVEENGDDGLSGTSVVDDLPGEEEVIIVDGEMFSGFEVFFPLEEEDESVNIRLDFVDQFVIFHTVDFFDLDGRSAYFLDKFSENSGVRFDRAPLIEHEIYN